MTVYVESSAVLAWLLDQPVGWLAFDTIRSADHVVSSDLTLVECDRVVRRRVADGEMDAPRADALRSELSNAAAGWNIASIGADVVARARASYPDDRVRTLDAIHLATAVTARSSVGDLAIVTLDDRIRENATALGFRVLPE
ncbi:type II toxin-antitoxin system VapC family toxin [soil metagenome]